eukprot:4275431-Amphidinium_carterae.1
MSSPSDSPGENGLPVVDSDITLPYESSGSGVPHQSKRETERLKPGGGRRSKSVGRVRRARTVSVGAEVKQLAASSPSRPPMTRERDVLRLESTVRQMDQAWHELNHRATIEVSEQQRHVALAHQEVEQMKMDAAGLAASTQSALSSLRAEASSSVRNIELAAEQRYVQAEEEAARKHSGALKHIEGEYAQRLSELVSSAEGDRAQLRRSAEAAHLQAMQMTMARHEDSGRAWIEQKRLMEAEHNQRVQEWQLELKRRDDEARMMQQRMAGMQAIMEQLQAQLASASHNPGRAAEGMVVAASPPPPPPPNPSDGNMCSMSVAAGSPPPPLPNPSSVNMCSMSVAAGSPPPPPPLPNPSDVNMYCMSTPRPKLLGPPPGINSRAVHGGGPGGPHDDGGGEGGFDDPSSSSDDDDDYGHRNRRARGKKEAAVIALSPLPSGAAGFRRWKTDALRDIAGAAERPRKAYRWIAAVTDDGISDAALNKPGWRYESLDGKLLAALTKIVAAHPMLQRKLHAYYEGHHGVLTSGRLTLRKVVEHYNMDASMSGLYS